MQNSNPTPLKTQIDKIDECYFAGYSKSDIHTEMLGDQVRVEKYTKAINETCKGKVVLDLGCGTGVLSLLAIKAGAIKVYAVDNADIEKLMSSEFKQLMNEGKIEFIKGTIEKLA
jgi:predicted RNA methylase